MNQLKETDNVFQEECNKRLDNQPGNQRKVKRNDVNPYSDIVMNSKTFDKILKKMDAKNKHEKHRSRIRNHSL